MKMTGSKFDSSRDVKDIAKLVRKDIKAAIKDGSLPKIKVSVRTVGCFLDVTVKAVEGMNIVNENHVAAEIIGEMQRFNRLSDEAVIVRDKIRQIVDAYNRQNIDTMTDYYNVRFSGRVNFDYDLRQNHRAERLIELGIVEG